jgi:L-lactate utilization protein LutC
MTAPAVAPLHVPNKEFTKLASPAQVERAAKALEANGIHTIIAKNGAEAKALVLSLIPEGAEVLTNISVTLDALGISKQIEQSGCYDAVRTKYMALDRKTQGEEIRRLRTHPAYIIGSVHAVTEDGRVLVASNSGSNIGAYAYGASHVLWVVGAQKIVKDLDEGMRRIEEYSYPLEDVRLRAQYGIPSFVSKVLIVNREWPGSDRVTMIIVNEELGF